MLIENVPLKSESLRFMILIKIVFSINVLLSFCIQGKTTLQTRFTMDKMGLK